MIKLFLSVILFLSSYTHVSSNSIYARSYIVMDVNTNTIMEGKNYQEKRSVASISKVMTAILAIESEKMFLDIVVDDVIDKAYGSMLYLKKGDSLKLEELVYGLMLRSGNDAALCIAKAVSGSVELFVEMMNKKAKSIGMHDTFFVNPHGLDESDGGNISTAKDMAILMSYAVKNENFVKISGTKSYRSSNYGVWKNKNKSLTMSEYIDGGKTGYTKKAKRTLVTSSSKKNSRFVVVTLDCGGDFSLHKQLHEKYLDSYISERVISKGTNYVDNYVFESDKDYFITKTSEEMEKSKILYEIEESKSKISIYFVDALGKKRFINNFELVIIMEDKKESIFEKIINLFKGLRYE